MFCITPVPQHRPGCCPPHAKAHCMLPHSLWGCGSAPTAPESTTHNPQHTALTLNGKTAKLPAEKAVPVVNSGWVYVEQRKKDVFPENEPNFPLSLASSHAHSLPPACTPPPQSQEGSNKQKTVLQLSLQRGCSGNPRPGITTPPLPGC